MSPSFRATPNRRRQGRALRGDRGFALLIVLWALVLLAFVGSQMGIAGRTATKIARNLLDNAQSEAAADAAVFQAGFQLLDDLRRGRRPALGIRRAGSAAVPVTLTVADDAGKINPNLAPPALLHALLDAVSAGDQADMVAQSILDWRGGDGALPREVVAASYRAAGLAYLPPRAPFATLEEVGLVLGMTPALFANLAPHLSLSQTEVPDPAHADPVVARALARQTTTTAPAPQPSPGAAITVSILARAEGPNGARFTRRAVLRLGQAADLPRGYSILEWAALPLTD
jgi:general secretion pathway protein K